MTVDRWLSLIGVLVSGLISWLFARYYYRRSEKLRSPTFVLNPVRRVLATPELSATKRVSILFEGSEAGRQGISEGQVYFWNSGTLPILNDEVLEPFAVTMPGTILRASMLKASRGVAGLKLLTPDSQRAVINFSLLEPGDGATLSILYDGPPEAKVEFQGACVGSPKPMVLPHNSVYFTPMRERLKEALTALWVTPLFLVGAVAASGATVGVLAGSKWLLIRLFGERVGATTGAWLVVALIVGFGVFLLAAGAWGQYKKIRAPYLPPDVHP